MTNLDNLMLRREHFVVKTKIGDRISTEIKYPPYHELLKENGIVSYVSRDVVEESLDLTSLDLEELLDENPNMQKLLDYIKEAKPRLELIEQDSGAILIKPYPTSFGELFIEPDRISPHLGGDHYIVIPESEKIKFIAVSKDTDFSPELMEEYGLEIRREGSFYNMIDCKNNWRYHNVNKIDKIFYKNLIIALNNAAVREKYDIK